MIEAFRQLFFPSICFSCRGDMEGNAFLCEVCRVGFEVCSPAFRCRKCFREKERGEVCLHCRRKTPWWESRGALFSEGGAHEFLLFNQDRFGKELAMLAFIQVIRFGWSLGTRVQALSKEVKREYEKLVKGFSFACERELYIGILPPVEQVIDKRVYLLHWSERDF